MIGEHCKTHYFKYLKDIVAIIVELQDSVTDSNSNDTNQTYLKTALERVCPHLITDFPDTLEHVLGSVIKLIRNVPKMSLSEKPKEEFSLSALIFDEDENKKEKKNISMSTSETQDIESSITLLNTLVEKMGKVYLPFISMSEEVLIPLLCFYINDEVRIETCNAFPTMLTVIKNHCSVDDLHIKAKLYITSILTACDTEFDNGTLAVFLDNMGTLVEIAGMFLNTQDINSFFEKIMILFDNTEIKRLKLLADQKKVLEAPVVKEDINSDDEEEDDDDIRKDFENDIEEIEEIQEYTADIIGKLFKTHKELTMEMVGKITKDILPKYFRNDASVFEIKMGIFIVDDLIEFLGQDLLSNIWDDLAKIVIGFNTHHSIEIRRAASYGVGIFAKFTKNNFEKYAADCCNCLINGLNFQKKESDDDDQFEGAKDNATSSLGKIIKHQNTNIDLAKVIPNWLNHLPILVDLDESEEQHLMLCQIINNKSSLVIGDDFANLPQVLKILARIYQTKKYSNDEIDGLIKGIIQNVLSNPTAKNIMINTREGLHDKDNKIKKKLETFISGNLKLI